MEYIYGISNQDCIHTNQQPSRHQHKHDFEEWIGHIR